MPALMVQGASSGAGKSLLTTALARALRRRGVDVVPFKAQNMSNNARVVAAGEIGTAQYLQALAAGLEPDVRMNPVLVKPEGDDRSQVVVLGRPDLELSRRGWRQRPRGLWPVIERALRELLDEHELVLLEGAGSPAEINLHETDLANMRVARLAAARVLLVADIDRGGAFAHLYGTWALLPEPERALIAGFVLNKFRGDSSLLAPAPERLRALTGVPTVGVLPLIEHGLPDEDGVASAPGAATASGIASAPGAAIASGMSERPLVAVIRYPTASNLDELKLAEQVADIRWIGRGAGSNGPGGVDRAGGSDAARLLERADLVILPGSKHVAADLGWLRATGLAAALQERAAAGRPLLGICGGMQMLGERIEDAIGVDGSAAGLGLLPLVTSFCSDKRAQRTAARFCALGEPWAALGGIPVAGYEIRHGRTGTTRPVAEALPAGLGYVDGPVLGVYLHGLFEQPELLEALFGRTPARSLEQAFDELADALEAHVDVEAVMSLCGVARAPGRRRTAGMSA